MKFGNGQYQRNKIIKIKQKEVTDIKKEKNKNADDYKIVNQESENSTKEEHVIKEKIKNADDKKNLNQESKKPNKKEEESKIQNQKKEKDINDYNKIKKQEIPNQLHKPLL